MSKKKEKQKDATRYKTIIGIEKDFKTNYTKKLQIALSSFKKGFSKLQK